MKKRPTHDAFTRASPLRARKSGVLGTPAYTTPTSRIVRTKRTTKIIQYSLRLTCAMVGLLGVGRGNQINEGKNDDPHQIDEVPEQARDLDVVVLAAVEVAEGG